MASIGAIRNACIYKSFIMANECLLLFTLCTFMHCRLEDLLQAAFVFKQTEIQTQAAVSQGTVDTP